MSITDIIVVSIAGIIVAVAVVMYIIRRKKNGSCCMGCSNCIYNQSHEELNGVTCNSCDTGSCNAVGRDECKNCESHEERCDADSCSECKKCESHEERCDADSCDECKECESQEEHTVQK